MSLTPDARGTVAEPRYDAAMLRKVTALATRLQEQHRDTLSAGEIEAIGAEVGLDAGFIRQALAQLSPGVPAFRPEPAPEPAPTARARRVASPATQSPRTPPWGLTIGVPIYWAVVAMLFGHGPDGFPPTFFYFLSPLPLSAFLGFMIGERQAALRTGLRVAGTLGLSLLMMPRGMGGDDFARFVMAYFLLGGPLMAGTALLGAGTRNSLRPAGPALVEPAGELSRPELVSLLLTLQRQLEAQKVHRAVLSLDVADILEMKQGQPDVLVEHSFGAFRRWMEDVVRLHGGEVQLLPGAAALCVFPDDAAAVRAARRLQDGLAAFNAAENRLPVPFRLRCGLSAGDLPLDRSTPLVHLQSAVLDRALVRQKLADPGDIVVGGEIAAAALAELGLLAALPEAVGGEPAFSWRRGQHSR